MLAYAINEWDNYAVEEAIRVKEKFGGNVTAVTVGKEDDEEVLRRCLAMGADRAIRVDPEDLSMDSFVIAKILSAVIKGMPHDFVLTGVQADDTNEGAVGVMLAENRDREASHRRIQGQREGLLRHNGPALRRHQSGPGNRPPAGSGRG